MNGFVYSLFLKQFVHKRNLYYSMRPTKVSLPLYCSLHLQLHTASSKCQTPLTRRLRSTHVGKRGGGTLPKFVDLMNSKTGNESGQVLLVLGRTFLQCVHTLFALFHLIVRFFFVRFFFAFSGKHRARWPLEGLRKNDSIFFFMCSPVVGQLLGAVCVCVCVCV